PLRPPEMDIKLHGIGSTVQAFEPQVEHAVASMGPLTPHFGQTTVKGAPQATELARSWFCADRSHTGDILSPDYGRTVCFALPVDLLLATRPPQPSADHARDVGRELSTA